MFLETGEKVRLDISTVDAIENVVGKEGVGNRKVLSAETDGQTMARAADTLASRKNFLLIVYHNTFELYFPLKALQHTT